MSRFVFDVRRLSALATLGGVLLLASRVPADEVELLSGIRVQGRVLQETDKDLVIEMGQGDARREITFALEKVHAITVAGQRRVIHEKVPAPGPRLPVTPEPPKQRPDAPTEVVPPPQGSTTSQPVFVKPTPEEALAFLKTLPRVWRNTRDYDPKAPSQKILVQLWERCTAEDLKTMKIVHPGGHVDDPDAPNRFSQRHLRIDPRDWRFFTVFEQAEAFVVAHDMEGVTDECFFYLAQLRSLTRLQLAMTEPTGEGVKHLADLKNLKSLSVNLSKNVTDVALVHAAEIGSLEYLDVSGCPRITGSGVGALAKLKNLKVLKIGGTSLTDAALADFKALTIEELDLSDNVADWVMRYRGGGQHTWTVTFAGLKLLLSDRNNLPRLKRLTAGKDPKSLLKGEILTKTQKAELAKLRPGLEVR